MHTTQTEYLLRLRDILVQTLPRRITLDMERGASADLYLAFVDKRWVIAYVTGNMGEHCIFVKSRSLFKAVWKTHKQIIKVAV